MSEPIPVKRRRGGQTGNQNAKNNRGNAKPRLNLGNRGGKGAPEGNQYARKPCRSASTILFEDYKNNSEARKWIEEHRALLDSVKIDDEKRVDRATRDGHLGLTPDRLAERGAELRFGLWSLPSDALDQDIAA